MKFYSEQLENLMAVLQVNRRERRLLHDNATAHRAKVARQKF